LVSDDAYRLDQLKGTIAMAMVMAIAIAMAIKGKEVSQKMLRRSLPPKQWQRRGRREIEREKVVEYKRFRGKKIEKGWTINEDIG
jgi:hypothetical protein